MSLISSSAINAAFNSAVASHEAGNVPVAMRTLQFLTLLAPTDEGVWRALARCHEDIGELDIAIKLRWLGRSLAEAAS